MVRGMDLPALVVLGLWSLFAIAVLLRLGRRGAETFDARLTPRDRRLLGATALYLGAPAAVLGSQLLGLAALRLAGGRLGGFETWVYWAELTPAEPLSPTRGAIVAAVPSLALVTLVASLGAWTWWRPGRGAANLLRLELARIVGVLALGVHPMISVLARRGDHHVLRESLNALRPPAGEAALLGYACVAALAAFLWRRGHRLRALATPLHDAAREATARLAADPGDADAARLLGAARLACDHPGAIAAIEQAASLAPDDPRVELLHGQALLRGGEPESASAHLRRAGQLFEAQEAGDASLLFEIELALTAARIALGDAEGAVLTAEAARATDPGDPRGLLLLVDALVAMGRTNEARGQLERARGGAEGAFRREIERRLKALASRR